MYYNAKVCRVININTLEVEFYLGFGMRLSKIIHIKLTGNVIMRLDEQLKNAGMHCLVVLIGGKKVTLEIKDTESRYTEALIYRAIGKKYEDNFIGFMESTQGIPGGSYPEKMLDVNRYMHYLKTVDYNVQDVRKRLCYNKQ